MLKLKDNAEVRAFAGRKEFHGDDMMKGVTVRLKFAAVPLDVVQEGFVSQLSLFYNDTAESQLPECDHVAVSRKVDNVRADIGGVVINRAKIDHVILRPRAGRVVEMDLKVKGLIEEGMDQLHDALMDVVEVELVELRSGELSLAFSADSHEETAEPALL